MFLTLVDCCFEVFPKLLTNRSANADPTWLSNSLEPRRNVYAVPNNSIAINNNVTDVHTNAKLNLLGDFDSLISHCHFALNRESTLDGFRRALEREKESIPGAVNDPSGVGGDGWVDDLIKRLFDASVGSRLVALH